MSWKCEQVHEMPLRPARTAEEFTLHRAALEWSLAEPIIIENPEDIKSRPNWRDRLQPYDHQVQNLLTFCRRLPVLLLADDVGLGKTISACLILSELVMRRRVRRTLVVCPKILMAQWVEELDSKFGITAKDAVGAALTAELNRETPVVITTYDSARSKLEAVEAGAFDMLVLDEAHKLRNLHGGASVPQMAQRVRDALEQRLFKYVLMLTATPLHNRLWDLYSLVDFLTVARGHKHPLGSPDEFKDRYIKPGSDGRKVQLARAEELRGILRQYLVRTRRGDAKLKFPERKVQSVTVSPTIQEVELTRLVAEHIKGLGPLQQTSLAQALVSSPEALAAQMENMAQKGSLPSSAAIDARRLADSLLQTGKLTKLLHLLDQLRKEKPLSWRAVVFTHRTETQDAIGRALKGKGIKFGFVRGGEARRNQEAIESFRADAPTVNVLVSTDAGAEGINLQVSNVLVNYDLPWNPMVVEQRIGRVQRLASAHAHVIVCNLVIAGSFEERVVVRLMEKLQLIAHAIGDIEAILETVADNGDDEEESFEKQIRDLVLKSLLGQDVGQATRLAQESIERAQRHLEEQQHELEETLGHLDALHRSGPSLPKLTQFTPSIPARDFVLRAKKAEGARVDPAGEDTFEVQLPDKPRETITFDEAVALNSNGRGHFMGNAPRLYQPGRPAFERLTQHWVDHYGHHVWDLWSHSGNLAKKLAQEWCATLADAEFRSANFVPTSSSFQGFALLRVKASNAIDSYEKLVGGTLQPEGHRPLPQPDGTLIKRDLKPSEILPTIKSAVMRVVEADKDMAEFCRFYEARRVEDMSKAGNDPRMLHKINTDFSPQVFADIGGLYGGRYETGRVTVRFTLVGGEYDAVLDVIPATGQILAQPPRQACAVSGRLVPQTCLDACAASGKLVLRHLLTASGESGRKALPRFLVRCPVTGKQVLQDELAVSALTGKLAVASVFKKSTISDRQGLPEEMGRCQITGVDVLRDELVISQVSGRLFRNDEQVTSVASGITGHRIEFVICQRTGQPILESEAGRSAVSGKVVRLDLLFTSAKPPGRLGLRNEFVRCDGTGKFLLSDEAGRSAVSGKWYDRDLLAPSALSAQLALPDELVTCQESGARLLPEETGTCCITGKRVDLRLLARSEFSGASALAGLIVRCAKTKRKVLPSELFECALTKAKVLLSELEVCAITGRRGLRDRLVRSDVSGRYVIPDRAVKSALSQRLGALDEVVACAWLEAPILKDEVGVCRLTGLTVAKKLLNCNGELKALRHLLDGRASGLTSADGLLPWLTSQWNGALKGLRQAVSISSPRGGVIAVCGEQHTFLGLKVRHVGLLVRIRGERAILGRLAVGRRTNSGWEETRPN